MSAFHWSNPFGGWDDSPLVSAADVIRRWSRLLAHENPWSGMPRDDFPGLMRPTLSELLNEARDADHETRLRRLVRRAHDHGAYRSAQGLSQAELMAEIEVVRDALEGALRKAGLGTRAAEETLATLDAELELAERAAVRGWHRGAVRRQAAQGSWFDRLLEELE
jgi:hypothetical protein